MDDSSSFGVLGASVLDNFDLYITKIKKVKKYKIQILKSKKFKKNVVTKATKKLKVTIKSEKIKNAKKVYVRAKAVVTLDDGSMEGPWSKIKKVKIKK